MDDTSRLSGKPPARPPLEIEDLGAVEGRNFSGRSNLLREFVGLGSEPGDVLADRKSRCAFIGPEIYNALSGLARSVEEEIQFHYDRSRSSVDPQGLLEVLGLASLNDRNPFDISGGEQALTAIAAALAFAPDRLALDCCFEQVDEEMRERVLRLLRPGGAFHVQVAIADNRLGEFPPGATSRVRLLGEPGWAGQQSLGAVHLPPEIPAPPHSPTIRLDSVEFSYRSGAAPVLRDVSATLNPGRVYVLEGRNGSGKSTLAKILCGAARPRRGRIYQDGRLCEPWREPGRVFAYHFQNPDLQLFATTVKKEIEAGPRSLRAAPDGIRRSVAVWAESFGLRGALDFHPLDLPFVARKRVALAATLAMDRPWLVLDEPTLGQDDETSDTLLALVRGLTDLGYGVIVITHSVRFRRQVGGQRLTLEGGALVAQG